MVGAFSSRVCLWKLITQNYPDQGRVTDWLSGIGTRQLCNIVFPAAMRRGFVIPLGYLADEIGDIITEEKFIGNAVTSICLWKLLLPSSRIRTI